MKKISIDWIKKNRNIFKKQQKIIVLAGAGTSVGSGLPTYRSKNSIFDKIKKKQGVDGETFFTAEFINKNRSVFLQHILNFYLKLRESKSSITHKAYGHLSKYNHAIRVYTQNVDGLEEGGGLFYDNLDEKFSLNIKENFLKKIKINNAKKLIGNRKTELVYLHGNLKFLSCTKCINSIYIDENIEINWKQGIDVDCNECTRRIDQIENKRLRKINYESGFFNTNIIMYDMDHPDSYSISSTMLYDRNISLLLIIGTSMRVHGVRKMANYFLRKIKENGGISILINRGKASGFEKKVDLWYDGSSDEFFKTVFQK